MRAWFSPIPLPIGRQTGGIFLPVISGQDLFAISKVLKNSAKRLKEMPVTEIAEKIEFAAKQWLKPNLPERKEALSLLPKLLPFSEPVCKQAIDALMEQLKVSRLLSLLDELLGDHKALDSFLERGWGTKRKAFGANLAFLVLASNIVGVGIWDIVFCLLCKTPILVKPSIEEPLLTSLFAQSLEKFAPELANSVAVLPFESERDDLIDAALGECDVVIVYGTDETIGAFKRKVEPKVRLIERGHKFSVAIVVADFANEMTADLLALDIARSDQRGCLSPQVCFLVGSQESEKFAKSVAVALDRLSRDLPPNPSEVEKVNISHFRLTCEMLGAEVFALPDASWTVVLWDKGQGKGDKGKLQAWQKVSCSARVIHIVAVQTLDEVFEQLLPLGKFLQGVAVVADEKTSEQIAEVMGQGGASRVCPIGKLQIPPIDWSQDGKHLISELVRWCDLEQIFTPSSGLGWVEIFRGDELQGLQVRLELESLGIPFSLETAFDPEEPTKPLVVIRVPAHYEGEAKSALVKTFQ